MIEIELEDLQNTLKYEGKISGLKKRAKKENIANIIRNNEDISKALSIYAEFEISPKMSLFIINNMMGTINDKAYDDANIILSTKENNNLKEDEIVFTILLTGIK